LKQIAGRYFNERVRMAKIAILGTRGIPALYGGFETFAEELSVRLVERGHDVTVYCEAGEGEQPEFFKGVRLEYLPAPKLGSLSTILFDIRCLWHARKSFDIVYMLGYGASAFCFIPRLWGSEVWINMDGVEWARSKWGLTAKLWFRFMETAAMWTPDRIIADAEGILAHLQSRHIVLPESAVIPYGAPAVDQTPDPLILDEWNITPGSYDLIVCRLEPENSVQEIISGYLASTMDRTLIVVGGIGTETEYVKRLLRTQNRRVRFIGTVYDKKKLLALRYHAAVYFHGHTVGGTNPSLLEAMGCGNVIVAHDNVFNRETAGNAAFYFRQPSDISLFLTAVATASSASIELRKNRAQQRIRMRYTWDGIVDQYERELEKLPQTAPQPSHG
jgi:glycosyltransferase involved in cell wall biosynthesis